MVAAWTASCHTGKARSRAKYNELRLKQACTNNKHKTQNGGCSHKFTMSIKGCLSLRPCL